MRNITKLFIKGAKIGNMLSYGKSNVSFKQRKSKHDVRIPEQEAILHLPKDKTSFSINKSVLLSVQIKPLSPETVSLKTAITRQESQYVV